MSATADVTASPQISSGARSPMRRLLARLRRSQDGAAAVEFGLIAVPFLGLLFAIIETALIFFTGQVLETAVANASRTISTGQFQSSNDQTAADIAAKFKEELCKNVIIIVSCNSPAVHVDVRRFTPGDAVPEPIDTGNVNAAAFQYQATKSGDIVLVRVAIEYPVLVPALNALTTNLSIGKRLIM
jgi:Flp pilus assembly protein TadG